VSRAQTLDDAGDESSAAPKHSVPARDLAGLLSQAERRIALVERCSPTNASKERERVLGTFRSKRGTPPRFEYPPAVDLSEARGMLEAFANSIDQSSVWGRLYVDRARELALEARVVEARETPEFVRLAAERFAPGPEAGLALEVAQAWSAGAEAIGEETPGNLTHRDLVDALRAELSRRRLSWRVEVSTDLVSVAATGDRVVYVRQGVRLSQRDIRRIVTHEIEAHVARRAAAAGQPARLFALGTRGASDDEEGIALLGEQESALLDETRKRKLGLRHLAAVAVQSGSDFVETMGVLLEQKAPLEVAVDIAFRVHRGGGLAREIVYLPAMIRVQRGLDHAPDLDDWLARGRLSVAAALELSELEDVREPARLSVNVPKRTLDPRALADTE
jgi:hypothetical protein